MKEQTGEIKNKLENIKMILYVDLKLDKDIETLQTFISIFKPQIYVLDVWLPANVSNEELETFFNTLSSTNKKVNMCLITKYLS